MTLEEKNESIGEQLKTIHNLAEAGQIILRLGREDLLPTIIEEILVESQNAVDDFRVNERGEAQVGKLPDCNNCTFKSIALK